MSDDTDDILDVDYEMDEELDEIDDEDAIDGFINEGSPDGGSKSGSNGRNGSGSHIPLLAGNGTLTSDDTLPEWPPVNCCEIIGGKRENYWESPSNIMSMEEAAVAFAEWRDQVEDLSYFKDSDEAQLCPKDDEDDLDVIEKRVVEVTNYVSRWSANPVPPIYPSRRFVVNRELKWEYTATEMK